MKKIQIHGGEILLENSTSNLSYFLKILLLHWVAEIKPNAEKIVILQLTDYKTAATPRVS